MHRMLPKVRGASIGPCNICGLVAPLTEDHVPPKGTLKLPQADLFHIADLVSVDRPIGKKRSRHMQSGMLYKSLCGNCNNSLLGAKYDQSLIDFANGISEFLRSSIQVPFEVKVRTKPGLLARAVIGHLLAVDVNRTESTILLDAARSFVLQDSLPLPTGIEVHYWVYPYRRQVAIRDASLMLDFFKTNIVFWCLKFFPVGFMVTWGNEHPHRLALPKLRDYMLNAGTHDTDVPVRLDSVPHQFWPEAPSDDGAVFYGEAAHAALPRNAG